AKRRSPALPRGAGGPAQRRQARACEHRQRRRPRRARARGGDSRRRRPRVRSRQAAEWKPLRPADAGGPRPRRRWPSARRFHAGRGITSDIGGSALVIRVLVAEDHPVVRAGLLQLLEDLEQVEVVGAAAGGVEATALAGSARPDVVLMDLEMPELDGIEATRRLRAADPYVNVFVLTAFSDRERILDAIDAGAVGYLLKDAEPGELVRGLEAAARGESPLSPKAAQALVAARANRSGEPQLT